MDIKIIPMDESCLDDVLDISRLSFAIPWTKNSFQNELRNNFATYVVAKVDERVIGYGGMWIIIDEGHITNIAVHPDYRGQGIGNTILNSMINICNEKCVKAMTLEVRISNIAAQNLYKKYGFIKEGVRHKYYEDNKEDAVIMWKRWV
ncbi:ribosomal-protein-alanine acetyltransferase [Clostridium polyendosporum]|uniref:[Ribosomal protein bS18]-alanine N-acetyltransferase n=1 Tax=Clostridium polyendosporum TaxID=69208 RepID=A0A919RZL7_9CLOT|nr:ribosomal protein S18-alanine N-acetyltransferase [Clostridium polyendosporum]GIM29169.1 ribosomal-protein-alanine acetyltransferase [Clostridium polyendosporum]